MKLQNKVAIVTGAAQGLGWACAERLHADGAKVLLVDIREDLLKARAKKLGDRAAWCLVDLSNLSQAKADAIVNTAVQQLGGVDILINNAGIVHVDEFVDLPEDIFDKVLSINLRTPFLLGQAAAKVMIRQARGGSIVNMSSVNAILAIPTSVAYAVSKGGIKQLTAAMAVSLIPHGIRVNAIGPGTILTDLAKNTVLSDEAKRRVILSRTPAGRCGDPSEVASVASFLCSDDASYVVGQTVYVDGGRLVLNYTVPVQA